MQDFAYLENLLIKIPNSDILLANLYNLVGNSYFPSIYRDNPFPEEKNLLLAAENYKKANERLEKAIENDQESDYALLASIPFSRAQVFEKLSKENEVNHSEYEDKAKELYRDAILLANQKIGEIDNYYIQYILNYILSASYYSLNEFQKAQTHIISVQEELREFATIPGYTIFSPLTKRMLSYLDLRKELNDFRKDFS